MRYIINKNLNPQEDISVLTIINHVQNSLNSYNHVQSAMATQGNKNHNALLHKRVHVRVKDTKATSVYVCVSLSAVTERSECNFLEFLPIRYQQTFSLPGGCE